MWHRIEIRNYRSIESISVDLAPFTVMVGPNGSGKSNFADAFVFARDVANDASTAIQSRGGIAGVRRWRPSKPTDVTIDIRKADTRQGLDSDYFRHSFVLTSKREGRWAFKKELIEERSRGALIFQSNRERTRVNWKMSASGGFESHEAEILETTSAMLALRQFIPRPRIKAGFRHIRRYRLNPELMRQPQLATERDELDESGANVAAVIRYLRHTSRWKSVLLAMRKIVPGLVDIQEGMLGRYLGVQFVQKQAGGASADFAATEMSEGAIRALGILIAAQQPSGNQLLILEEPEVSIHPGAAAVLFEFLKATSQRRSILLTTHSAELLDAAKDEETLVCEYRDGITQVGPMESEQRRLVKEGLLSAAELMHSEPLRIEGMPPAVIPHEEAQ